MNKRLLKGITNNTDSIACGSTGMIIDIKSRKAKKMIAFIK